MKRILGISVAVVFAWMTTQESPAREMFVPNIVEIRSEHAGIVYFLGQGVVAHHPLQVLAANDAITVGIGGKRDYFRPFAVGDFVTVPVLAVLTNEAALGELTEVENRSWEAKKSLVEVLVLKADLERNLWSAQLLIDRNQEPAGSAESDRKHAYAAGIRRTVPPQLEACKERKAAATKAVLESEQAFHEAHERLMRHEEHPLRGRVRKILVQPGQAVRAGDVILQIELDALPDGSP
jgi:biotin carboxyl carrier protein